MLKWIKNINNIVSHEMCDSIMNENWDWQSSTFANNNKNIGLEKSKKRVIMDEAYITDNIGKYWARLLNCTKLACDEYKKSEDLPKMHLFIPERTTNFRINRYGNGGFMSEHIDNIHHSHKQKLGFPQASLLFFLNDDYEGGEIYIADKMFKPKKGSAIIFPSNFMYPHHVDKVTKGTRYSIITWLM
jgi:hypothetical protein